MVELTRVVGSNGTRALLTRALRAAVDGHPVLSSVEVLTNSAPSLAGIDRSVEAGGAEAVANGLAAVLVHMFELLGRLIGDDLTMKIAERVMSGDTPPSKREDDEQS
jgi:hypothetical protein